MTAIKGNDGDYIYVRNIINSFIVAITVSCTTVLLASITGYGLAKFRFRGRNLIFMLIMATMMIPFEAIMIPLYMIATKLHIQNTYTGLILPFMVSAFGIFMMRQYLITFPNEFLDAARVDGMHIFKRLPFAGFVYNRSPDKVFGKSEEDQHHRDAGNNGGSHHCAFVGAPFRRK